jgi:hypothetical protein
MLSFAFSGSRVSASGVISPRRSLPAKSACVMSCARSSGMSARTISRFGIPIVGVFSMPL